MRWLWCVLAVSVLATMSSGCLQDFDQFRPHGTGGEGGSTTSTSTSVSTGGGGETSSSTGGGGTGGGPVCGDQTKNGTEACDGSDLEGQTCESIPGGYVGGTLMCLPDCSAFDTSQCIVPPSCGDTICNNGETCGSCPDDCGACCGNTTIENGEQCDGVNLNGEDCTSIAGGFISGTLNCKNDCTFDTTMCNLPSCGDTICNNGETCASCPGDCGACCGNGAIDSGESCDGANLGGKSCTTIPGGYISGTLGCKADCTFNTSMCNLPSCGDMICNNGETCVSCPGDCGVCCGNGTIDNGEKCDGNNLGGKTCSTIPGGFSGGTLACLANCTDFNTSGCIPATVCGNNIQEGAEVCDGTDLNGKDCTTIPGGFTSGMLGCLANCSGYDTSACYHPPPTCSAGASGTVDNITASGAIQTSYFIHFATGADFFSTTTPTTDSFNGSVLPGQFVLLGKNGEQFDLKNGATAVSKTFYKVDLTVSLPSECSGGTNLASQNCAAVVAKSFRCQFPPYLEVSGCPSPAFTFMAQAPVSTYNEGNVGFEMVLVDLTCQ